MSKVYAVITEYLGTGAEPSCELFEGEQDAREYVLDSIFQELTMSTGRYEDFPIWKQEVLDACAKAQDEEDISNESYQFAVECFNNIPHGRPFECYWIFGRKVNPLLGLLDCIPACV